MRLLSSASANTKTRKAQDGRPDYRLVSLALSPDKAAPGLPTNCPHSTPSCVAACVANVGLASIWKSIMAARIAKTQFMRLDRAGFIKQLLEELKREKEASEREGTELAVRLNCFSDLPWFTKPFGAINEQVDAHYYDYSKCPSYFCDTVGSNYHITFSRTETNEDDCAELVERGCNIAVVFGHHGTGYTGPRAYNQTIPKSYVIGGKRRVTYDADQNDMRFLDFRAGVGNNARVGRVAALRLKASNNVEHQKALSSGFAVTVD